jgi:hypothetical protein
MGRRIVDSIPNFIKIRQVILKLKDSDGHAENIRTLARKTRAQDPHTHDEKKFAHKVP